MKKITLLLILFTTFVSAQEYYWTTYSFSVDAEDEEIVAKLTNDYFSSPNSKSDGVSVFLFENHFNDSENNSSTQLPLQETWMLWEINIPKEKI